MEQVIVSELKKEFSPEFINRIDDLIIFNSLGHEELRQICRLLLDDVNAALANKGFRVTMDDAALDWLLERAAEESSSGARPLRRAIQRHVEDELSEYLIRHKNQLPERIDFTVEDGIIVLKAPEDEVQPALS